MHVAPADAVGERDAPGPAGTERAGLGVGRDVAFFGQRRAQGHGAVVEQAWLVGGEFGTQLLAQQPPREAGAVHEEVAVQFAAFLRDQVADVAVLFQHHVVDVIDDVIDAVGTAALCQEFRQQSGVEVISIVDLVRRARRRSRRRLALGCQFRSEKVPGGIRVRGLTPPPPVAGLEEGSVVLAESGRSERMEVASEVLARRPVRELNAVFIGGVAGRHEFGFRDAEEVQEALEQRRCALADADGGHVARFDEADPAALAAEARQEDARRHPAGAAAADDHDMFRGSGHLRSVSALPVWTRTTLPEALPSAPRARSDGYRTRQAKAATPRITTMMPPIVILATVPQKRPTAAPLPASMVWISGRPAQTSPSMEPANAPMQAPMRVPSSGTTGVPRMAPTIPPTMASAAARREPPALREPAAPRKNSRISPRVASPAQASRMVQPNIGASASDQSTSTAQRSMSQVPGSPNRMAAQNTRFSRISRVA